MFTVNGSRYFSYEEELDEDDYTMDVAVDRVFSSGTKGKHEYDFGTSTELSLQCVSQTSNKDSDITILARNNSFVLPCDYCGCAASEVCTQCIWDLEGFVCNACKKKHACEEDYLLPVCNSPRMGMCGFTGEDCPLIDK